MTRISEEEFAELGRGREAEAARLAWTEAQFQSAVRKLAVRAGWRCYHTHDSRKSDEGYPDLTLIHSKRRQAVWLELKSMGGVSSLPQREWIDAIQRAGFVAAIVKPTDWDWIRNQLTGGE